MHRVKAADQLNVHVPVSRPLVIRPLPTVSAEQRERAQVATEYNLFSFPASLVTVDFLSDSGTGVMTDLQWASLLRGDESYARNHGYYALLDSVRDVFERGDNPKRMVTNIIGGTDSDVEAMMAAFLETHEGGFVNGGPAQLERPNCFITPQGRCCESLLFSTMQEILTQRHTGGEPIEFVVPSNGFFDTTEANASVHRFHPVNLFSGNLLEPFPLEQLGKTNPFKGGMDTARLRAVLESQTPTRIVPMVLLTVTNNTAAGQPVAMANIREVATIAKEFDVPLFLDACRFAENATFIQKYEAGFAGRSVPSIIQEMATHVDGFWISLKKDGLANIGGIMCFRDRGVFWQQFSEPGRDVGCVLKEKQILNYGNDSYGGLSGRDIMAAAVGMQEVVKQPYLDNRLRQTLDFATALAHAGVPAVLPPGGHAVYLDMNRFFSDRESRMDDFLGVGFAIELLRIYGIRACELGPFAFEWDQKSPEDRKGVLNLVRFALPRNAYTSEHIAYATAAIIELYRHRQYLPAVEIVRGTKLHLRHFQSGLRPIPVDKPTPRPTPVDADASTASWAHTLPWHGADLQLSPSGRASVGMPEIQGLKKDADTLPRSFL